MKLGKREFINALKAAAALLCLTATLSADQFGDFTYSDRGSDIWITGYPTTAIGPVVIPSTIVGKPVTSIGSSAFRDCSSLTSVTIPTGVISIKAYAFRGCSSLTSVTIPTGVTSIDGYAFYGCSSLTSVTIPTGVTSIGISAFESCWALKSASLPSTLTEIEVSIFQYCWQLPSIVIPESVTRIGEFAFHGCSSLASVTIPSSVSVISNQAFAFCESLTRVSFIGDMPTMGALVFYGASPSFTVYYFDGAAGFTSPFWLGFPSVNMGAPTPFTTWLHFYGFPLETDLLSDLNGDGVSLLIAYALNLDPTMNLASSMPKAEFGGDQLSIAFFAGSEGVIYLTESSTDLKNWSSFGVTLSEPDGGQVRTATVSGTGPRQFLRLTVSQ